MNDYHVDSYWGGATTALGSALIPSTSMQAIPHALVVVAVVVVFTARRRRSAATSAESTEDKDSNYDSLNNA